MGEAFTPPTPLSEGDRDIALGNEILRTVVGSEAFGMELPGVGDRDEMGVYVETPEQLLGLEISSEHYVSRTKPEGVRSGPGDVDLTMYSLRKFAYLACAGNPTILTPLFVPSEFILETTDPWYGFKLRSIGPSLFLSQRAGGRFLGYLNRQRERMTGGGRQSRVPKRPELIEAHGYDTKYASHALRLGYQGVELMTTGWLDLPMHGEGLEACMEVKRGDVTFEEALRRVDEVRDRLVSVKESGKSPLPKKPDMDQVNRRLVEMHQHYWRDNDLGCIERG